MPFSLNHFLKAILLPSGLRCFWRAVACHSYYCSPFLCNVISFYVMSFFYLPPFKISFIKKLLIFGNFIMMCWNLRLVFILLGFANCVQSAVKAQEMNSSFLKSYFSFLTYLFGSFLWFSIFLLKLLYVYPRCSTFGPLLFLLFLLLTNGHIFLLLCAPHICNFMPDSVGTE